MQPLPFLLASAALLAPSEVRADDRPSGGHAIVRRVTQMDATDREEWVRETLQRLDRANRVVLRPDEVADWRTRYGYLLRQMAQGKALSEADLLGLLRETDQREKAAVEQLARRFRAEVYRTFRQRRGVFTRRRAAWSRVQTLWEEAGRSFEQQDELIVWLESAILRSTPGMEGPLPPDPQFHPLTPAPPWEPPAALALQEMPPWINEPFPARPPGPAGHRPEQTRRDAAPKLPGPPSAVALDVPQSSALPTPTAMVRPREAARHVGEFQAAARPRPFLSPRRCSVALDSAVSPPMPTIGTPNTITKQDTIAPEASAVSARSGGVPPGFSQQPAAGTAPRFETLPVLEPPIASAPRRTTADESIVTSSRIRPWPERDTFEPPIASLATADFASGQTIRAVSPKSPDLPHPPTNAALRPDSARPAEPIVTLRDPFLQPASHLAPEPIETLEDPFLEPATETAPASLDLTAPPTQPDALPNQPSDRVNVDELKARIGGTNLALQALETELHDEREWNARELAAMIERLRVLVRRTNDLRLVWELISRDQQADAGRPDSPSAAISRLAANIYEACTRASAPDFPGTTAQRETELVLLDELSRELVLLATGLRSATP